MDINFLIFRQTSKEKRHGKSKRQMVRWSEIDRYESIVLGSSLTWYEVIMGARVGKWNERG